MRPAHRALTAVTAAVAGYNVFIAPDGETISEGFDELLERYPLLTTAIIFGVACHCANRIPATMDPLGLAFVLARRLRRPRRVVVAVEPA